jgi:hypothetical protein
MRLRRERSSVSEGAEKFPFGKLSFSTFLSVDIYTIFVLGICIFDIFAFNVIRGNRKSFKMAQV